jgi:hypothetical protein
LQTHEPALGQADLLLALPGDHAQALGEVVGDRVGREGQGLEQIVLQQPRGRGQPLGPYGFSRQ